MHCSHHVAVFKEHDSHAPTIDKNFMLKKHTRTKPCFFLSSRCDDVIRAELEHLQFFSNICNPYSPGGGFIRKKLQIILAAAPLTYMGSEHKGRKRGDPSLQTKKLTSLYNRI